jgi:3-oxoacyl-[acyl-carrier protein] reductase
MNILITGVSGGLGIELCRVFLLSKHHVYGTSRKITPEISALMEKYSSTFSHQTYDLNVPESIKHTLFDKFAKNSVPFDCFINNAASAYDDIITNMNINDLRDMFNINVFSPMIITKYILRNMLLNKTKGSIIHISSISAHTGYKGLAMYASSKGAIEAFSKNTAREWGVKGIRSNVVVPGFMETAMSASLSMEQKEKIYRRTSLKQATSITSVAETALFLASEQAHSITGQSIHVDAGTI